MKSEIMRERYALPAGAASQPAHRPHWHHPPVESSKQPA